MACHLKVWSRESGQCQTYVCDEENTGKIIEDDHASKGKRTYNDTRRTEFSVDWTQCRLIHFVRKTES